MTQGAQSVADAFPPDLAAPDSAEQKPLVLDRRITPCRRKMHEPDRFLHRSAPGTGNAGDGDGDAWRENK